MVAFLLKQTNIKIKTYKSNIRIKFKMICFSLEIVFADDLINL